MNLLALYIGFFFRWGSLSTREFILICTLCSKLYIKIETQDWGYRTISCIKLSAYAFSESWIHFSFFLKKYLPSWNQYLWKSQFLSEEKISKCFLRNQLEGTFQILCESLLVWLIAFTIFSMRQKNYKFLFKAFQRKQLVHGLFIESNDDLVRSHFVITFPIDDQGKWD